MFEHDGAEDSDAQPVTTGVIANFTAIKAVLSRLNVNIEQLETEATSSQFASLETSRSGR